MSALDDAIAQQLAHAAGSLADPLTDSLCDQATRPAELQATEPIYSDGPVPPWLWAAALLTFLATALWPPFLPGAQGPVHAVQAQASAAQAASGAR